LKVESWELKVGFRRCARNGENKLCKVVNKNKTTTRTTWNNRVPAQGSERMTTSCAKLSIKINDNKDNMKQQRFLRKARNGDDKLCKVVNKNKTTTRTTWNNKGSCARLGTGTTSCARLSIKINDNWNNMKQQGSVAALGTKKQKVVIGCHGCRKEKNDNRNNIRQHDLVVRLIKKLSIVVMVVVKRK